MSDGYQSLTEKEKAALRLLLAGHDAKSMAGALGLSVHTVNERLRDARRKLSVSSSKAAARILRDAESPQLLGDSFSGDAPAHPKLQSSTPAPHRRAAWTIGGTTMIALFAAALALSSPQNAAPPAATTSVAESDATQAARNWLALVDARNWQESWAATGANFRKVNTLSNWQSAAEGVHARLGPALSRELLSDFDTPTHPNGARSVRFRTTFANNQGKTEVLSLNREGDNWRVNGIYVE